MGMADWSTIKKLTNTKALFISRPEESLQQILFLHYRWKARRTWQRIEEGQARCWKNKKRTHSSRSLHPLPKATPDLRKEQEKTNKPDSHGLKNYIRGSWKKQKWIDR